jgi:hypothetical protein
MSSSDVSASSDGRESGGRTALIWALWGGIVFAVVGESLLFLLADASSDASTSGLAGPHLFVSIGFALLASAGAAFVYARSLAGEGLPTALLCWMLLKSVAITGLVAHQLGGSTSAVAPFFGVFAIGMGLSNPSRFRPGE